MPSPSLLVLNYFIDKMDAAGYDARFGYNAPDLGRALNTGKIICELWLTDGRVQHMENDTYWSKGDDILEMYMFRALDIHRDNGKWYDDVDEAYKVLTHNPQEPERSNVKGLYWDGKTSSIDRTSPLKRWDNGQSFSEGVICARIDLPITIYPAGL